MSSHHKTSVRTNACGVRQKGGPRPTWEATRRIAYDTDEDQDEDVQSTKTGSTFDLKPDLSLLIKSTEALACSIPRLKENRSKVNNRTRPTSSTCVPSVPKGNPNEAKKCQASMLAPTPVTVPNINNVLHSDPVEYSKDEWLIVDRYDYSSRWHDGNYGRWVKLPGVKPTFRIARVQPEGSIGYRPPPKPKITFTSLPPEIRNKIYEYVIPERSVLITRTHPQKEARMRRRTWSEENVARSTRARLTHEPEWDYSSEDFVNAINLLLTCKRTKTEIETFLYSRFLFCFHSLKDLRRFLLAAPETGLQSLRKILIVQHGYGNSLMTLDQKFRGKYYQSWDKVCTLLGQKTTNLKHLKLKVYDREWPSELSGKEYAPVWKSSLLKIAPSLLAKVEVRLHHQMIDENEEVLKDLARQMEDSMMTEEGRIDRDRLETERVMAEIETRRAAREERESSRRAKLNAPPPRTELVISMNDIGKQTNKAFTTKKFRSKGLERFGKITPCVHSLPVAHFD